MAAHPVALPVNVDDDRPVEKPIEMAPATIGSSLNTFPHLAIPKFVVNAMLPFR